MRHLHRTARPDTLFIGDLPAEFAVWLYGKAHRRGVAFEANFIGSGRSLVCRRIAIEHFLKTGWFMDRSCEASLPAVELGLAWAFGQPHRSVKSLEMHKPNFSDVIC